MNNKNNILQKFKPQKILGKGSEGIDNKYTIKIYNKPYLTAIIFLKIITPTGKKNETKYNKDNMLNFI